MIEKLTKATVEWINEKRNFYYPQSKRLSTNAIELLSDCFKPQTLESARVCMVDKMPLIDFDTGDVPPIDFSLSSGLTLQDVILIKNSVKKENIGSLLIHELVHVEQFEKKGVEGFVREYLSSYIENGFSYRNISLEQEAYQYQDFVLAQNFDRKVGKEIFLNS